MNSNQLNLNIDGQTESEIIASSRYNFKIELIHKIGKNDINDLIETSKELVDVFGEHALLSERNILKYFNDKTLPFVARQNDTIIGYIIGVPLENFKEESWSHFDTNLHKNNTLYTYALVLRKKYQKRNGYAKTLKRIYINWAKKRDYKYISGHVKQDIAKSFPNTQIIKTFPVWYDAKYPFDYYRREI